MPRMIDTHAHLVTGNTQAYPPSPPSGSFDPAVLADAMTAERLLAEMDTAGVDKAVLVQRGSIYGFDSSYVCDSASRIPKRLAAVCSIDATAPDCAEAVRHWVEDRGSVGIRLMELVKETNISWLDSSVARGAWTAAAELGAPVCVHLFPWNRAEGLMRLKAILGDIPDLTVVLDHFAAIKSNAGPPDHGVDDLLRDIAAHDGVAVKFTTIPLGRLDAIGVDFRPVVARVRDLFGASRMMWGSDITQSEGSYKYMAKLGRRAVDLMTAAEQEQILAGTALRVYAKAWS